MQFCNVIRGVATAAVVAIPSLGRAEDLRKDYVWFQAEGLPPKLGLQPKNPDDRTMSFEYLYMECNRRGQVIVRAWPLAQRGRASTGTMSASFVTDAETVALPNPRKSFNEMDSVWQVTATAPDLTLIRTLLPASSVRFSGTGIALTLPPASREAGAFLRQCEQFRR